MIEARLRLVWPGFSLEVDERLPAAGVTVLFGHSGSGKTTLLRCIAGLEQAADGFLTFKGEVWQDARTWVPPHRRPLGYVFQEASLFPHLTVLGNLRYGRDRSRRRHREGDSRNERVSLDQAIELLGIGHLLDRKPGRLSGGERQRVGIARALAVNPRVLLMDEPLAALDLPRKQEILPYMERLHEQLAIPVVYVSHSSDEVARLADHLVVMDAGSVLASGALSDVLSRLDLPIRLGEETGVVIEGRIVERDARWHLVRVSWGGEGVWVRDPGGADGRTVRVRILARDVSLARERTQGSSILNILPARVIGMGDDEHPALTLAKLTVDGAVLLARLTRRSCAELGLMPGRPIWIQIKAVALL